MPDLTPIPNFGSQLDRAIVAYLIAMGAGTAADTFPAYQSGTKKLPNTTIRAFQSQHEVKGSGNEVYNVSIQSKFPAAVQPGQSNPHANWLGSDRRIGLILAAMLQTDDGETLRKVATDITTAGRALAVSDPTNNSDMAEFTLEEIYFRGSARGTPEEDATAFVEVRNFECHGCPLNLDEVDD